MAKKMQNNKSNGSKKKQSFSFRAPEAMTVQLVGDFTHWQQHPINLRKGSNGVWQTTVALEPGKHHYRFLVDGQWRDDPECLVHVANPYGGQNMIRQVA